MYANYAVWLGARVCHLAQVRLQEAETPSLEQNSEPFIHRWHSLWTELQDWFDDRPEEMVEVDSLENAHSQKSMFPFILYAAACAISSNQLYHASCLLMLDMKPASIKLRDLGQRGHALWHAHRICGISLTNAHHGCLNNAIQPLWLAGKLLSHPAEHKMLANLIKKIEAETGWSGSWRLRNLLEVWGYANEDQLY